MCAFHKHAKDTHTCASHTWTPTSSPRTNVHMYPQTPHIPHRQAPANTCALATCMHSRHTHTDTCEHARVTTHTLTWVTLPHGQARAPHTDTHLPAPPGPPHVWTKTRRDSYRYTLQPLNPPRTQMHIQPHTRPVARPGEGNRLGTLVQRHPAAIGWVDSSWWGCWAG